MSYPINCPSCGGSSASDILDLIENHTDFRFGQNGGTVICSTCKHPATVFRRYNLQEKDQTWHCWIRGVVRIPSEIPTYVPYALFTTSEEAGNVSDGIMISYYKDTRHEGGRLKHGHGPGGPAVLGKSELLTLISSSIKANLISREEIIRIADTSPDLGQGSRIDG
jgi:hypothetical protein